MRAGAGIESRAGRPKRGRVFAALAVAGLTALALALPAVSGAAGKSSFKVGLYVGKTSQGEAVKLRVANCDFGPCLTAPNDDMAIIVLLPCPSINETSGESLLLVGNRIAKNGSVNASENGFATTSAIMKVGHNGSLTGRIHSKETLEDGAKCDSGNVTLSAKIGGSTK